MAKHNEEQQNSHTAVADEPYGEERDAVVKKFPIGKLIDGYQAQQFVCETAHLSSRSYHSLSSWVRRWQLKAVEGERDLARQRSVVFEDAAENAQNDRCS